ncbi:hypothetical protein DENIS_0771 [Desulfonema ishimotonii]|uniref:Type II secretion system protein GspF domain-containing protein n=1 Tax=Desulfonema ishimotonii TaxID=45657 RepID=A0A401FSB0_9BACT|nr:type II secretion system F family protein [Desulfonema ishimotonii]GBC59830.1 hypothetical protein DENIS_0771 [Desulfonema ishimotonii]
MPVFRCRIAPKGDGKIVEKTLMAESPTALKNHLEGEGNFVFEIQPAEGRGTLLRHFIRRKRVRSGDFFVFNQEFAVLLRAGLPVVGALDTIIEKGEDDRSELNRLLTDIREDIAAGESLSGAFGKYAHIFSRLYSATLQAGEKSGDIITALTRYTDYMKKVAEIRQQVIAASVYPVILTVVSVFTLVFLLVFVVPTFTESFFEAGTQLPAMTRVLIGFSITLRSYFASVLAAGFGAACGLIWLQNTETGRGYSDRWKLVIPFISGLYRSYFTARFARTLSTMLSGGTPLPEALRIATGVLDNRSLRHHLNRVIISLEQGDGLTAPLSREKLLPVIALRMIGAGESGGSLPGVLQDVADFYDSEVNTRLAILTAAIEPGLMVMMGGLIGFIVLAMYLPIFQLAGTIS